METEVRRLDAQMAPAIVACFQRVYGDSYANELFYEADQLANAINEGRLCCVGAVDEDGIVRGHMAMTIFTGANSAELGNTVVDPLARGGGLAWRIGDELTLWCREKGYLNYLHYPTTDHHIMQRQSVKSGFETGLMLGYIPAETDGQAGGGDKLLRGASTIVVEPLTSARSPLPICLPDCYQRPLEDLIAASGLPRELIYADPESLLPEASLIKVTHAGKRGLSRLHVEQCGQGLESLIVDSLARGHACLQIDFLLSDPGVCVGVNCARSLGAVFCGWLPGYAVTDVLRLQWVTDKTDRKPGVVNPTAQVLLEGIQRELDRQGITAATR